MHCAINHGRPAYASVLLTRHNRGYLMPVTSSTNDDEGVKMPRWRPPRDWRFVRTLSCDRFPSTPVWCHLELYVTERGHHRYVRRLAGRVDGYMEPSERAETAA